VPVGTRLHWSTDSRPVWVGWDGTASAVDREAQCGRRTKINWTKTAHNTRICTCICRYLGVCVCVCVCVCVYRHTHTHTRAHAHTHTPLCGYGLSTWPTEGLSSWWSRNTCTNNYRWIYRALAWIGSAYGIALTPTEKRRLMSYNFNMRNWIPSYTM